MNLENLEEAKAALKCAGRILTTEILDDYDSLSNLSREQLHHAVKYLWDATGCLQDAIDSINNRTGYTVSAVVVSNEGTVPVPGAPEAQHAVD